MSRVFVVRTFDRWARGEKIEDDALLKAIERADQGLIDANLGGGVVKLRVAREGQGRSAGFRTIVALIIGDRAFFMFGFAKNELSNIGKGYLADLKELGESYLSLNETSIEDLIRSGAVRELKEGDDGE